MKKYILLLLICLTAALCAYSQKISQYAGVSVETNLFGSNSYLNRDISRAGIGINVSYGVQMFGIRLVPTIGYGYSKTNLIAIPGDVDWKFPEAHYTNFRWGIEAQYHPLKFAYIFTGPNFVYAHSLKNHNHKRASDYSGRYWKFGVGVNFSRFFFQTSYQVKLNCSNKDVNYPLSVSVGYNFWQK